MTGLFGSGAFAALGDVRCVAGDFGGKFGRGRLDDAAGLDEAGHQFLVATDIWVLVINTRLRGKALEATGRPPSAIAFRCGASLANGLVGEQLGVAPCQKR